MGKVCVILGAGASHDVLGPGASVVVDNLDENQDLNTWRPPLASELFAIATKPNYEPILVNYGGAKSLAQSLAGNPSLESELRRYSEHEDPQTRQTFKHIPPYIRDVIRACCDRYI